MVTYVKMRFIVICFQTAVKEKFTFNGLLNQDSICYDLHVLIIQKRCPVIVVGNGHGDTSSNPGRD